MFTRKESGLSTFEFLSATAKASAVAIGIGAILMSTGSCAGPAPDDDDAAAVRTAGRQFLSIGTAPPGGAFFPVGGALAGTLNENRGEESWQVTAEATKGTQENIRRLTRGELDLALANSAITYFAVRGEGGWKTRHDIRVVMTLAPNVALFVAPKSAEITAIEDLRGKRVVLGPAGAGFEYFLGPILGAHGLTYDDLTPLYATQAGAVDLLADGAAAAAFLGGAVPTASITQAATSGDIDYVPYRSDKLEELLVGYPFFDRATIPAGTYSGLTEDYAGLNVGSMHLITTADMDEELIYQVTRTLWENRASVVEKHAAGRAINPRVVVRHTGTEFHPGAVRWFEEIGIWSSGTEAEVDEAAD
ncbi:MAG: TAXI family TRAP transporter solute-binding subunit [Acidobacteriota bacterium]|nr:TAXI family TRAP transporter solute-binding subunit [Acidobacteriota bacterium]